MSDNLASANLVLSADKVGRHFLSGAAHYYDTYETADGKYVSIGSLEQEFYELLIQKAGLERSRFHEKTFNFAAGQNPEVWKELKVELAAIFKSKTAGATSPHSSTTRPLRTS